MAASNVATPLAPSTVVTRHAGTGPGSPPSHRGARGGSGGRGGGRRRCDRAHSRRAATSGTADPPTRWSPRGPGPLTPLRAELTLPAGVAWTPFRHPSSESRPSTGRCRTGRAGSRWRAGFFSLLHVPGDPPLVLRIGGDSSSEALWERIGARARIGRWLTPAWLASARALVQASRGEADPRPRSATASPAAAPRGRAGEAACRGKRRRLQDGIEPTCRPARSAGNVSRDEPRRPRSPASLCARATARMTSARLRERWPRARRAWHYFDPRSPIRRATSQWTPALLTGPHPALKVVYRASVSVFRMRGARLAGYATIARLLSEAATAGVASRSRPPSAWPDRAGLRFASRAQFRDLWRSTRRERHVRRGAVGARRAVRAAPDRGRWSRRPRPAPHGERRVLAHQSRSSARPLLSGWPCSRGRWPRTRRSRWSAFGQPLARLEAWAVRVRSRRDACV